MTVYKYNLSKIKRGVSIIEQTPLILASRQIH